jgi:hypothetical protein
MLVRRSGGLDQITVRRVAEVELEQGAISNRRRLAVRADNRLCWLTCPVFRD